MFLDDTGETVPLNETELPLMLPELDDFTPTGTGDPPLAKAASWVCIELLISFWMYSNFSFFFGGIFIFQPCYVLSW